MSDWTDRIDQLRLIRSEGVGPITYRRLIDRYHTPAAALAALPRLARSGGRASAPATIAAAEAERELERTNALGGRMVFLGEPDYPPLLAMMDDAPPCLIVKLGSEDQHNMLGAHPEVVVPGVHYPHHGWTRVWWEQADDALTALILRLAWLHVTPKRLHPLA